MLSFSEIGFNPLGGIGTVVLNKLRIKRYWDDFI